MCFVTGLFGFCLHSLRLRYNVLHQADVGHYIRDSESRKMKPKTFANLINKRLHYYKFGYLICKSQA